MTNDLELFHGEDHNHFLKIRAEKQIFSIFKSSEDDKLSKKMRPRLNDEFSYEIPHQTMSNFILCTNYKQFDRETKKGIIVPSGTRGTYGRCK
jgi:hypothetical protein